MTSKQVEVALIEPTATGLKKSIMDATMNVRSFLKRNYIHDYDKQSQGPDNKAVLKTRILTGELNLSTTTSLYRPQTKKGDPRIWISGLGKFCKPGDIIAIAYFDGELYTFNLTELDLKKLYRRSTPIKKFISLYEDAETRVADELLERMKVISAKGFIAAPCIGDTAVGRLLEDELGIKMNSDKVPDYKGIELKSARAGRENRKNLFAQVPNWKISRLKSTKEILDNYGYERDGVRRLYCTVNAINFNPQSLKLKIDEPQELLTEYSSRNGDVVSWEINTLQNRLLGKHKETFWVEAESKIEDGVEYLRFTKVEHTKNPLASQMSILIEQGKISVDHLIKAKGNSAVDKGPIFKLGRNSLSLLFPPSETYTLN